LHQSQFTEITKNIFISFLEGAMNKLLIAAVRTAAFIFFLFFAGPLSAEDAATIYKQLCATCHDSGLERAPAREAFRAMTPERVLAASTQTTHALSRPGPPGSLQPMSHV
jgi:hypothetical protein